MVNIIQIRVAEEMKVRFVAEIVDDNGNTVKAPVTVETDVPDVTEFTSPSEFYKMNPKKWT